MVIVIINITSTLNKKGIGIGTHLPGQFGFVLSAFL